jgi:T5orf172 domain-containing protein
MTSGIYIVTLHSDVLVPVTQDRRYPDCADVNSANVKVGKARDFSVRERDYRKDFGADKFSFKVVAVTSSTDIQAAETAVLRRLRRYRKLSPKGGMMDWLETITLADAIAEIYKALTDARISYVVPT